tara:strand:+ start:50334 stop:51770 length:1437 start_codon:yes stop_codon:yes gene_type:complete
LGNTNTGNISFSSAILTSFLVFGIASIPFIADNLLLYPVLVFLSILAFYIISNSFKTDYLHIIYFFFFLVILSPPLEISSNLPRIRLDEILIYLFFPIVFLLNPKKFKLNKNGKVFFRIYLLFIGLVCISTLYGKIFLAVPVGRRDFFEIVTYLKYLIAFVAIYSINLNFDEIKRLLYAILFLICVSGIFGLIQFFGLFGIDNYTAPIYLLERSYIVNERLTATFKNPNNYSVLLVIGHIIALSLYFYEESKRNKLFLLSVLIFFLLLLFFAGSRTMIASYLFITIILIFIISIKRGLKTSQVIFITSSLSIVFIMALSVISYETYIRLQSGVDILNDESFAMRIIVWYLNILVFLKSPLLGWGPAKDLYTTVVDSEYILILRRYGIVGFTSYIFIYLHPLVLAFKKIIDHSKEVSFLSIIYFSILITFLITCLTNSVLHDFQLMDLWIVLLAIFLKYVDLLELNNSTLSSMSSQSKP